RRPFSFADGKWPILRSAAGFWSGSSRSSRRSPSPSRCRASRAIRCIRFSAASRKEAAARPRRPQGRTETAEEPDRAQTEDTPRRRQALQKDEGRKVSAGPGVQAAHLEQQDGEAEARAQGDNARV